MAHHCNAVEEVQQLRLEKRELKSTLQGVRAELKDAEDKLGTALAHVVDNKQQLEQAQVEQGVAHKNGLYWMGECDKLKIALEQARADLTTREDNLYNTGMLLEKAEAALEQSQADYDYAKNILDVCSREEKHMREENKRLLPENRELKTALEKALKERDQLVTRNKILNASLIKSIKETGDS